MAEFLGTLILVVLGVGGQSGSSFRRPSIPSDESIPSFASRLPNKDFCRIRKFFPSRFPKEVLDPKLIICCLVYRVQTPTLSGVLPS